MKEIRLSGSGGQGMILAGIILAEAAVLDGKQVVQTQDYGPEARGGASKAELIISSAPIDYPKVTAADIVLAMTEEACAKYGANLKPEAILIVDSTYVQECPDAVNRVYKIPITRIAKDELGSVVFANIVALGVLVGITEVVSKSALEQAVMARVPKGTEAKNTKALNLGMAAAQAAFKQ